MFRVRGIELVAEIPLTQEHVALVDADDLSWLSEFRWVAYKASNRDLLYARTNIDYDKVMMQNMIMGSAPEKGLEIDHIDCNGLNNQRSNLRWSTRSQNAANRGKPRGEYSSQYKGVYWNRKDQRWVVTIKLDYKTRYVGGFKDEVEAALAYDRAAIESFGEFAKLNFPVEKV